MTTDLTACERTARLHGLARGLADVLAGIEVSAAAPGAYAAVPAAALTAGAEVRRHRLADAEGIVFLRRDENVAADPEARAQVGRRLAATRIGLARRQLDRASQHLSGRTGGGEPLSRKQLVMGTVADAMTRIELLREYATTHDSPAALADLHDQLDALDWEIASLFGASGYIADNETRALYVSGLVANTWIDGEHNDDRI